MIKNIVKFLSAALLSFSLFSVPASANTWYPYKDSDGYTRTWFLVDNYNNAITGWYQENDEWYYLDGNGIAYNAPDCYYDTNNAMWVNPYFTVINNEKYVFDNKARMIHDSYIWNGFTNIWIDSNGHMQNN